MRRQAFTRVTTSFRPRLTTKTSAGTKYPPAVTGGTCRSLAVSGSVRLSGAIFLISRSAFSQPGGPEPP